MNTAEIFRARATEADERAAKAITAQEKEIWVNIASEYRQYAKMAAQDAKLDSLKVS